MNAEKILNAPVTIPSADSCKIYRFSYEAVAKFPSDSGAWRVSCQSQAFDAAWERYERLHNEISSNLENGGHPWPVCRCNVASKESGGTPLLYETTRGTVWAYYARFVEVYLPLFRVGEGRYHHALFEGMTVFSREMGLNLAKLMPDIDIDEEETVMYGWDHWTYSAALRALGDSVIAAAITESD